MAKDARKPAASAFSLRDMRQRHLERHRATGFGFAFADRIDYLDPHRWDSLVSNASLFLRRDLLRVIEQCGPENIAPRYAMIFREEKPVAALAAQVVSLSGDRFQKETTARKGGHHRFLLQRVLAPAAKVASAGLRERLLVAGNLLSWGFHGCAFAAGENPAELWPGIAEALYRIRRAEKLNGETNFVLLKDFDPQQRGEEALRRFSYRPMETEPNMVLNLDPAWRTYEDYLGALDAKYRRNAKDQAKKLLNARCSIEGIADLVPFAGRLHDLYLAVHHNAPVRLVTLPSTFLPAFARAAGDNFRCTIIRQENQVLGFVTTVRDGDVAIAYFIGFDRAAAQSGLPLYLRLLHATIGDAIHWGCKRLSLGRTALEPKAALGAKPEPMTVWLRHRIPSFNWLFRGLLGAIPHAEAPERNPFKMQASSQA